MLRTRRSFIAPCGNWASSPFPLCPDWQLVFISEAYTCWSCFWSLFLHPRIPPYSVPGFAHLCYVHISVLLYPLCAYVCVPRLTLCITYMYSWACPVYTAVCFQLISIATWICLGKRVVSWFLWSTWVQSWWIHCTQAILPEAQNVGRLGCVLPRSFLCTGPGDWSPIVRTGWWFLCSVFSLKGSGFPSPRWFLWVLMRPSTSWKWWKGGTLAFGRPCGLHLIEPWIIWAGSTGSQPVTSVTLTEVASSKRQWPKPQSAGSLVYSVDKLYMFVYCSELNLFWFSRRSSLILFPQGGGGFTSKFSMKPSCLGALQVGQACSEQCGVGLPLVVPRPHLL